MTKTPRSKRRLSSGFNLGGQQAEADPLLEEAFYQTSQFRAIADRDDPQCFIIGRTGSGKSALLQQLERQFDGHVIRIAPEDLALTYVADLQAVRWLDQQRVHLDPLFIALWKHVFLIELIKNRYKVHSPDAKQNFMTALTEKIKKDRSKVEALRYLEDFQGKFWCEADERVREIVDRFESQIRAEAGVNVGGSLSASAGEVAGGEERRELVARFQRVVNETQLPRLNQMVKVLDEDILSGPQHFVTIIIDDLDQDWVDDRVTNSLIRCLFRAVHDLKRVSNLKILVALRTNIFEALDFGHRTGGQEEKFRALSMRMRWSPADMTAMLDERTRAAGDRVGSELFGVRTLLPAKNKTRGDALEFIYRRTLMRPRDAIAYLNECLSGATANPRITWEQIHAAEDSYSRNRLLALRDEWKPTFPGVDRVFAVFEECPAVMTPTEFAEYCNSLALLSVETDFEGSSWLTEMTSAIWTSDVGDWAETYGPTARFLFDIGFLGCVLPKTKPTYSHDEPGFLDRKNRVATCDRFLIHPAFRRALDCNQEDDRRGTSGR